MLRMDRLEACPTGGWHALSEAKGVVFCIHHAHHFVLGRATQRQFMQSLPIKKHC